MRPLPSKPSMPGSGTGVPPEVVPPEVVPPVLVWVPEPLAEVILPSPVID